MNEKDWLELFSKCAKSAWNDYKWHQSNPGTDVQEQSKLAAYNAFKIFDYLRFAMSEKVEGK